MADEPKISLSPCAFAKPLLHATKYPHCSVNGVLLARDAPAGGAPRDRSAVAVDAVPLFHSSLTLAPMMEVALTQIDVYCKSNNLTICGYYQANENLDNNKPVGVASRLADKIRETCGEAFLLMIDNRKITQLNDESYILYSSIDGKWKKAGKGMVVSADATALAARLFKQRRYRELTDFDNYLDDITQDWLNLGIDRT